MIINRDYFTKEEVAQIIAAMYQESAEGVKHAFEEGRRIGEAKGRVLGIKEVLKAINRNTYRDTDEDTHARALGLKQYPVDAVVYLAGLIYEEKEAKGEGLP